MNTRQAYLAWLRQEAPATYAAAVQRVLRKPRSLGGLNRNLISSMYAPSTGFGFLSDSVSDISLQPINVDSSSFSMPDLSALDAFSYPAADLSTVDTSSFSSPDLSSFDSSAPAASSGSFLNSGTFTSLLNAATSVADTVINANAQSSLVQLNTQRAAQGLWPVQANGQPVPQSQLYPSATPSLARFESAISTQGVTTPILWVAGLGLLAFALFKRSR